MRSNLPVDEVHAQLGWLLMSQGWMAVMRPAITERAKVLTARLLDPTAGRKDRIPDDFIRGQVAALRWLIEWPEKEMQKASQAMMAEQDATQGGATPH